MTVSFVPPPRRWEALRERVPDVHERATLLRISPRLVRALDSGADVRRGALPPARVNRVLAGL